MRGFRSPVRATMPRRVATGQHGAHHTERLQPAVRRPGPAHRQVRVDQVGKSEGLRQLTAANRPGVIGALLVHPTGAVISLHADPDRAHALRGFSPAELAVPDRAAALHRWNDHLTQQKVEHSAIYPAHSDSR